MSATTTPPNAPETAPAKPAKAKAPRNRRSRSEEAVMVRAKMVHTTLAADPSYLKGIAVKDAHAAKVRIDKVWLGQLGSLITQADQASAGRAVARVDLKKATSQERAQASQLAGLLIDVRQQIATHFPDDANAQQAYGRGTKINPLATGPTIALAGSFLSAWDGKWQQTAQDAGVTQGTMDQIKSLRDALSAADMGQQGVVTTNVDGSLTRAALFASLRTMSGYATKVVDAVFGKTSKQALALSDPRPLTSRGAAKKAATRAKKKATKLAAKAKKAAAPKKLSASIKRRAKSLAVKARLQAVKAAPKTPGKRAKTPKAKGTKAKAQG